jgi:hypothetical protein
VSPSGEFHSWRWEFACCTVFMVTAFANEPRQHDAQLDQ